ncbi:diacylglycerol kinase family protein [Novosphingobium profundi]|uniref:diacylglycerol kinase family protein n=1 Tax=Novosphingobium profundi TaxID=1774954 RepID=UPI001BDA869D|nr:diacylglycerol kinase family protein [Novosphingobium profundi]MBT0668754.1 diacylglycerol kinase family protein [Novosphingobium profundi]
MVDHHKHPAEKPNFSIRARLKSFVYAGRGIRWLAQDEHNAWLHLGASLSAVIAGLALHISFNDWRWIVTAIAFVWVTEAINTAIEDLCNWVSPQFDQAIGRIKDIAAGAVLVASMAAAVIGLLTLGPPLLKVTGWL